jgi:hypothetical protein
VVEELGAETLIEEADMLADHLGGQAQGRHGYRKGPEIRRLREDAHVGEAIHDYQLLVSNYFK